MRFRLKFFPFFWVWINNHSDTIYWRHYTSSSQLLLCLCKKDSLAILMSYFWVLKSVVLICVSMPPPINTPLSWLQSEPQNRVLWLLTPYSSFPRLLLVILVLLPFPIHFRISLLIQKTWWDFDWDYRWCIFGKNTTEVMMWPSHCIICGGTWYWPVSLPWWLSLTT